MLCLLKIFKLKFERLVVEDSDENLHFEGISYEGILNEGCILKANCVFFRSIG